MGFSTDAIHAGQEPDLTTGAVITPIYMTSTYAQEGLGNNKGYEYGRMHNLTREALENNIAALEKGKFGNAFASGLAAVHALMSFLKKGDHVIVTENVYGGTYRLFETVMKHYGIEYSWVNSVHFENVEKALRSNTKMLFIETPTNPMLTLTDIKKTADFAKANNLISVVDNTFMSPYFQNPIPYGIDLVLHSSTKYLNGHSDVLGGIIISHKDEHHEQLSYIQKTAGGIPSPFDCWLTLRSVKTLALRMKQHNENAMVIAAHLDKHPAVQKVIYPGLSTHPQFELAKEQMSGFGGMITIDTGSAGKARDFCSKVKVFTLAESLGGVESLVCHPASMTHASVPKEKRENFGLLDSMIRLSVGIEDSDDLIEDIEQALK